MNKLAPIKAKLPAGIEVPPTNIHHEAQGNAVMEYAKRVKDWPMLRDAVDRKLDDQKEFIDWWKKTVRSDGRPKTVADLRPFSVKDAQELTGITKQIVYRWQKKLNDPEAYRAQLYGKAWKAAMGFPTEDGELVQQSKSNEHYTPGKYIQSAREVLGNIDLDPASCVRANDIVRANQFYSDDGQGGGLKKPWNGRVWLNPPYGNLVGEFIAKLLFEIKSGNVTSAITLVNAHCTDTIWFRPLWDGTLCFTDHRINFAGDETRSGSTHGSVFVYFGDNQGKFHESFSQYGCVVRRLDDYSQPQILHRSTVGLGIS